MYTVYASILSILGVIAQANGDAAGGITTDWIGYLLQGGPFAVVVILFVFEKLVTPGERDRLRTENKQYQKDIADLNLVIRDQIIPLLGQNNETMRRVFEELTVNERIRQRSSDPKDRQSDVE